MGDRNRMYGTYGHWGFVDPARYLKFTWAKALGILVIVCFTGFFGIASFLSAGQVKKMPGYLVKISAYFGEKPRVMKLLFTKQPVFPDSLVVSLQDSTVIYKLEEVAK